jgi:hypothetical protein
MLTRGGVLVQQMGQIFLHKAGAGGVQPERGR